MSELSSRYAQALFSLKRDEGQLLETQELVKELIKVIKQDEQFLVLLNSHRLAKEERIAIVDEVFASIDEQVKNFIKIIIENNRAMNLVEIFEDFNSLVNEYRGVKEGLVYTAMSLKENELEKITSQISKIEKMPIELKEIIDPSLIGGVKVVINDHIYDGSIKHHLENMKLTLIKKEDGNDEN